jgi:hypothetical protein
VLQILLLHEVVHCFEKIPVYSLDRIDFFSLPVGEVSFKIKKLQQPIILQSAINRVTNRRTQNHCFTKNTPNPRKNLIRLCLCMKHALFIALDYIRSCCSFLSKVIIVTNIYLDDFMKFYAHPARFLLVQRVPKKSDSSSAALSSSH